MIMIKLIYFPIYILIRFMKLPLFFTELKPFHKWIKLKEQKEKDIKNLLFVSVLLVTYYLCEFYVLLILLVLLLIIYLVFILNVKKHENS